MIIVTKETVKYVPFIKGGGPNEPINKGFCAQLSGDMAPVCPSP
jgi:hypothetical protein